jgi:hypothetical protein
VLDPSAVETTIVASSAVGVPAGGGTPDLSGRLRAAEALAAHYLDALEMGGGRSVGDERLRGLEQELDATRRRALSLESECRELRSALRAQRARAAAGEAEPAGGVSAHEAEVDAERSARLAAERARHAAESRSAEQATRIAELESLAESLGHALQSRAEAANRAHAATETAEHAAQELRERLGQLEREARAAPAAHAAPEPPSRVEALNLELAKTRGALEERELQIRRLERTLARRPGAAPAVPAPTHGPASLWPLNGSAPHRVSAGKRTRIGRATDNDVCIDDASVSRHHAVIISTSAGTFIEDLRSVNGVGVNGRRVRHARLAEGDVVTLGTLRFRFAPAAAAAAEG